MKKQNTGETLTISGTAKTRYYTDVKNHTITPDNPLIVKQNETEFCSRLEIREGAKVVVERYANLNIGYVEKSKGNLLIVDRHYVPTDALFNMDLNSHFVAKRGAVINFRDIVEFDSIGNVQNGGLVNYENHVMGDSILTE